MYQYDAFDQAMIDQRVAQFTDQMQRHFAGELSMDDLRPLRLQNGLYIQRHAPMFRIAVPYGMLGSRQLRKLAHIARTYDRGYAHFTTRHNCQYNWIPLEQTPAVLAELATVQMHAIQTSGNDVRNTTTDHFAGVADDEIADPRPWCELIRQWSTFNPEFAYLPRKFKIAVNAAATDRTVIQVNDIGLDLRLDAAGNTGFRVLVGGGLGRTPILGSVIREFLPWQHLITYLESILRVYNRYGRRDNSFKARIKILVKALGPEEFARQVEAEWAHVKDGPATLSEAEVERIARHFVPPPYETLPDESPELERQRQQNKAFARWLERNVHGHKVPGYAAVTVSLKSYDQPTGNISAEQMELVADLADRYSFGEARVSHEQNVILADIPKHALHDLWQELRAHKLATPTVGLLTDIICCPGGDLCALANAKSTPIALAVQERLGDLDYLHDIGEVSLNISGCMNACGHHHVGNIGVLGVDKKGEEWYQISIGGRQGNDTRLGSILGPSFAAVDVPRVIEQLIDVYVENRLEGERFIDSVDRLGIEPFKARVYGEAAQAGAQNRKVANG
ncbi:Sulfite reductase [Sterolibacterium denitrificans]|uniref:Sulfite reductase n=1 Tax=Sterolibacterium denitrificans TaxID=157592 RepID=A0A7Z7HQA9_9PROT|nr:nitrite/sulfite reductase [Sterolibacterium denitrificans]SMB23752.1 Sulfite reductase [Sterolibacterium denitrificans]